MSATDVQHNDLLAAMPEAELERWLEQLEPFELPPGFAIQRSGLLLDHVDLPISAIVPCVRSEERRLGRDPCSGQGNGCEAQRGRSYQRIRGALLELELRRRQDETVLARSSDEYSAHDEAREAVERLQTRLASATTIEE